MEIVVTGDNSKTLFNPTYKETYHSKFGAVTESRTIFIEGSNLAAALTRKNKQKQKVRVLEIGFGLGLNFLLSADLAKSMQSQLDYLAIEQNLLPDNTLQQLDYHQQLTYPDIAKRLYEQLRTKNSSVRDNDLDQTHTPAQAFGAGGNFCQFSIVPEINLSLSAQLKAVHAICRGSIDAIYLDAFSPDCNPECWTPELLEHLAGLLCPQGALLTYSAKSIVRRRLIAAGLQVQRLPGPPGKREFIKATPSG